MRFLMLYRPAVDMETSTGPTQEQMDEMGKFMEEMFQSGSLLSAEGLRPASMGARVRQANEAVTVTDGPYTETKEQIGGFAIVQVPSMVEALDLAKRFLKVAGDGETEIRQLFEASDSPCVSPVTEAAGVGQA